MEADHEFHDDLHHDPHDLPADLDFDDDLEADWDLEIHEDFQDLDPLDAPFPEAPGPASGK